MASFISVTAWSIGMTPVSLKNAACKMVLVRLPRPKFLAMSVALMV